MVVLQLASQYTVSAVYKELFLHLNKIDEKIEQLIFLGTRKGCVVDKYLIEENEKIHYIYKYTHGNISRVLYFPRIYNVLKSIKKTIDIKRISIVHAHTLFADGGTALLLKKNYNIDYVVTVRSTDINFYLNKMPHARALLNDIIINAKKIIFLSPNMYEKLYAKLGEKARKKLEKNSKVLPNGISDYWFENLGIERIKPIDTIKFLQVSELIKRKNVDKSIEIIKRLNEIGIPSHLDVVGDGSYFDNYINYCKTNNLEKYVSFLGRINDIEKMKKCYGEHDIFIMPSDNETFGLVYVEAMSQGLPIVYRINTGIYGYFDELKNGVGIDPYNIQKSVDIIYKMIDNYDTISKNCIKDSQKFKWKSIAEKILGCYQ